MFAIVAGSVATACLPHSSHHINVVRQLHYQQPVCQRNSIYVRRISLTTISDSWCSYPSVDDHDNPQPFWDSPGVEQYVKNNPGKLTTLLLVSTSGRCFVRHSGISTNHSIATIHPTIRPEYNLVRTDPIAFRPVRFQRLSITAFN